MIPTFYSDFALDFVITEFNVIQMWFKVQPGPSKADKWLPYAGIHKPLILLQRTPHREDELEE